MYRRGLAVAHILVAAAVLGGCGVGVGLQRHAATIGPASQPIATYPTDTNSTSATLTAKQITFYDWTGVLLAAIANNANIVAARQEAIREAIRDGVLVGEVTYEADVIPAVPGMLTTVRFTWGDGTGENDLTDLSMNKLSYWEFDFTVGMKTWGLGRGGILGFTLGTSAQSWQIADSPLEVSRVGMPLGLEYGVILRPRVTLTGRAQFDWIAPLLLSSVNEHWVDYTFGARLDISLTRALHVLGDVSAQRVPIDWGDRDGRTAQATINLAYIYNPKD